MKSRAPLVLMEQLVMVLVFALIAAMCLQAFVLSDDISRDTARHDQAAVLAQNGAETLKACGGDLAAAAEILGGTAEAGRMTLSDQELLLEIKLIPSSAPELGLAQVLVTEEETGQILFSLTVGWQEVD